MDWQVGGCHTEAQGVGDVVDGLDNTIGVHIAVGAPHHPVSGLDLRLALVLALVAIVVLAQLVLKL